MMSEYNDFKCSESQMDMVLFFSKPPLRICFVIHFFFRMFTKYVCLFYHNPKCIFYHVTYMQHKLNLEHQ